MGPASKQRARVRSGGAALTTRRFMPVGPVLVPPATQRFKGAEIVEAVANTIQLVRDFLGLPLSQRRFLAERYGVSKLDPMKSDFERDKRTIQMVAEHGKQIEFALLVENAKSR